MEVRKANSNINHYCLNNNVIVKRISKHSGVTIRSAKNEEALISVDPGLVGFEVVAYGSGTTDIELGDIVYINMTSLFSEVKVKDNNKSFSELKKLVMDKGTAEITNKEEFELNNYFMIDFYNIRSIIDKVRLGETTMSLS